MISPHTGEAVPRIPRGAIIYRGPSVLDTKREILGILTGLRRGSRNSKTGASVQLWILDASGHPSDIQRTRADGAICGDCPLRSGQGCYADPRALLSIWGAFQRGSYPSVSPYDAAEWVRGSMLRLGAYGDPAAIPHAVLRPLVDAATSVVGYTHQWRRESVRRATLPYLMASVETPDGAALATAGGWRTFRIRRPGSALLPGEIACPASPEGGERVQCADCTLCDGRKRAKDIAIVTHGIRSRRSLEVIR